MFPKKKNEDATTDIFQMEVMQENVQKLYLVLINCVKKQMLPFSRPIMGQQIFAPRQGLAFENASKTGMG